MTSPETTVLRQRLVNLITHRASSSTDVSAVTEAARRTHDDLAAVLAPLISTAGVEALLARAFDLVQREYPPPTSGGGADPPMSLLAP